jgi:branched-chain amino acid transport system ATP-binding protein
MNAVSDEASDGLEVQNLSAGYGDIRAVWDVSFTVAPGEILALLGRNGGGKTTTVNAIAGLLRASGAVRLGEHNLTGLPPYARARLGLGVVPEGRQVFHKLTVDQNLTLGGVGRRRRSRLNEIKESTYSRFPILDERRGALAGSLSGGQQQALAIAQALIAQPKVLVFDEPTAGLAPAVIHSVFDIIRGLADDGLGVLIVEQREREVMKIADRGLVMDQGRFVDTRASQRGIQEPVQPAKAPPGPPCRAGR